jgi:hypothetical protein
VPASAVAGPAPIDAMSTYLTSTEVLGRPLTDGELDQLLKAATDEHFIMEAATWLARLEHHGSLDVDFQLEAASRMFLEPMRTKVQNLITNGARLLAPQVLLGVIKAALLVSPAGTPPRADDQDPNPFTFVMLGVANRLGVQANDNGGLWGSYPADLSLEVARNQSFNVDHNFGSLLARYQRLWHDLPRQLAGEPGAVDVEGVFEKVTGVTLDDLLLVGAPAIGAAEGGVVRFERGYFYDNIPLPQAKLDAVFRLLATDKRTMWTLVRQESQASGFDWSYTTFRRYPMLHADNGDMPERGHVTTIGDLLANRWQTAVRVAPRMRQARCDTRPELLVWCGAPRRNRTGDPILTMDRRPSAVLSVVLAAHATPYVPQLWAQLPRSRIAHPPSRVQRRASRITVKAGSSHSWVSGSGGTNEGSG